MLLKEVVGSSAASPVFTSLLRLALPNRPESGMYSLASQASWLK